MFCDPMADPSGVGLPFSAVSRLRRVKTHSRGAVINLAQHRFANLPIGYSRIAGQPTVYWANTGAYTSPYFACGV